MTKFFFIGIVFTLLLAACKYESVEPMNTEVTDSVISYSKTILPLVTTQCGTSSAVTGCHESGSQDGDFTNYEGLKEKADDGSLFKRVVSLKDMPKSGSGYTLTQEERNYFEAWIKQGFQNN